MNTLKDRFAFARTNRGYTQMALADSIGVTRGVISNIEYGKTEPPAIVINAICQTLNINKEWLVHGTGPMDPEITTSPVLVELREVLERLPENLRIVLLDTARSMERNIAIEKAPHQTQSVDAMIVGAESRKKPNQHR